MDASSPLISPDDISIPSPAENLLLTSDVLNCVFVSVDVIVTAPPDSVIVTFVPAVNANVSPLAKVLPPAVTVLTAVMYEPVAAFNEVFALLAVNEFNDVFLYSSSTFKVLVDTIVPPPLSPVPAVMETEEWSICSFATNPLRLSCTISESVVDKVSPVKVIPVPPLKLVSSDISTDVKYEDVAALSDVLALDAVNEFSDVFL